MSEVTKPKDDVQTREASSDTSTKMTRKLVTLVSVLISSILILYACVYLRTKSDEFVVRQYDPNKPPVYEVKVRGGYKILQNYIVARKSFAGYESIAYTTHSDATFLENLIPLTERWRGPVSIAIYVPGSDYDLALQEIAYYRVCHEKSQLIQDYVTFHLYAEIKYANQLDINSWPEVDCEKWTSAANSVTFKKANNLTYPVNVGRNIARESALTHFVLASDIELYPNPGLIQSFLKMIKNTNQEGHIYNVFDSNPKAYVVSIFEIEEGHQLPQTKNELINLMDQETLIPFHQRYCKLCHQIPGAEDWKKLSDQGNEIGAESKVIAIGKRTGTYRSWEPIFIGTHSDPLYDERLSWEGRSDKMTHALQMCLMDYEFHVLDNAFLIHKPGIKTPSNNPTKPDQTIVSKQNKFIDKVIVSELVNTIGENKDCHIH